MTKNKTKEKMDLYRKWFRTFMAKEFFNLPEKSQGKFIGMVESFLKDCRKINEEAKKIIEKTIQVEVSEIRSPDNREENYIIVAQAAGTEIKISYPSTIKKPELGSTITHVVYSTDGEMWYSSKMELITGRTL